MQKELESFFVKPTCERYRIARNAVVSDSAFRVDYADVLRLTSLVRAARMSEAQVELDLLLPSWALSPRIHRVGAKLAHHFNDREEAELFGFMEQACLDGLCSSGSGSVSEPYSVLYPTDPLDVLRELSQTPVMQSVHRSDSLLDVFHCQGGAEIAFEAMMSAPSLVPSAENLAADKIASATTPIGRNALASG